MTGPQNTIQVDFQKLQEIDRQLDQTVAATHIASTLKPGVLSPDGVAVAGYEGYLFIGGGRNGWEEQFLGRLRPQPEWSTNWLELFERRQHEARARGVELWNIVAPEKQSLLAPKRWKSDDELGRNRPATILLNAAHQDHRFVYPIEAMALVQANAPIYQRHDSHWSATGCCAAAFELLSRMGLAAGPSDLALTVGLATTGCDLTAHFFDPVPEEEIVELRAPGERIFDNNHIEKTGQHKGAIYVLSNPDARDERRVIIFGDSNSYAKGFAAFFSAVFQTVVFVWSKDVHWQVVDKMSANVVIWECAERFIVGVPEH